MSNPLFDRLFGPHVASERTFLILPDGRRISYAAFLGRAAAFAHALTGLGLVPGDRVAVQVDKSADALALTAACAQAGLVFLPLNTAYTPAELDYFVGNSGAALLVASPANAAALAEVAARHGAQIQTLGTAGDGTLADLAEGQPATYPTVPRAETDLAAILYTSGTTGRSKGAMLSQRNLISNADALAREWHFGPEDVLLHALPIFHTHGLFVATNVTLIAGGAMILLPKLDIDALIAWMPQATALMGVPTFYTRLLADPRFDRALTAHMRLFVSGSAPLLAETHREFEARTGHRILERYGMTETNMNTSNPYTGERRPGTVGLPLPGVELRICDSRGTPVQPGEIGTIEVRGPNVFQGYWQMPEKTAEELRPDGFFITGDLGQQDAEGYVTIVGRGKDLIIAGGYNIYPKEVEEVLDDLPGVLESAVIGVPHPDLGEGVVAVLVPRPGATLDTAAIAAALDGRLARFKHPRRFVVVDALPRNTMGKVQKAALRKDHADSFIQTART
ncbi:MAG: AMP-binding protein [Limimaricola sp.]|uniref:malonate--CoA ligase n=1 Tax=Limimaricola sp. TaxID=2211665 RepID=UPI001D7960E5|nr:malonyl-CoA synthase [Limimaricola sp.]MBI1418797.1 AMP-binding protein [Limimaricola sp.]